jgi:hypothetical protein
VAWITVRVTAATAIAQQWTEYNKRNKKDYAQDKKRRCELV